MSPPDCRWVDLMGRVLGTLSTITAGLSGERLLTDPRHLPSLHLAAFDLTPSLTGLPWVVHAAVGLTLLAGLVLWLSGRRVLKATTAFLTSGVGAAAGLLLLPTLLPGSGVSPLVGCLGGWIAGLLAGVLLYRPSVALVFGGVLGCGSGLLAAGVLAVVAAWPIEDIDRLFTSHPHEPAGAIARTGMGGVAPGVKDPLSGEGLIGQPESAPPARPAVDIEVVTAPIAGEARQAASAARDLAREIASETRLAWEGWSARDRAIIGGATAVGLIGGALLGLSLPAWAAGAVTALVGSAIWLPCAVWLAHALDAPGREALHLPASGWAIVWVVVSLIGLAAQWAGLMGGGKGGSGCTGGSGAKG